MTRGALNNWYASNAELLFYSLDVGDITDTVLAEQNKRLYYDYGMNNLGRNGIGNQLFQYAALVGISTNVDLIFLFRKIKN